MNNIKNGPLYTILKTVVGPIIKLIFNFKVTGLENIPQNDGFILCSNHTHFMDVVFLVIYFKRHIKFMAKQELFVKPFPRWFVTNMGAFPVTRGAGTGSTIALKTAEDIVKSGGVMGIFPEGTRSKDGKPKKAKSGVALIASETNAPVLPVSIYYEGKLKLFKKITLRIGTPITPETLKMQSNDRNELRRVSTLIMDNIVKQWGLGHCK